MEALGVAALAAAIYAAGACPTFGAGNSPAWAAALSPYLGLWGANLLSSLAHAATLGIFYAKLRRDISRGAALGATAALGFSRLFWYYGLVAGPWALIDLAAVALMPRLRTPVFTAVVALPALFWLGRELLWVGLALAVYGALDKRSWPWLLLTLPAVTALGLWSTPYAEALARQRLLLPLIACAALVGYGLQRLKKPWLGLVFVLPAVVAPLSLRHHNPVAEYARAVLAQTPDDAVIVAKSRELPAALRALGQGGRAVVDDPSKVPAGRPVYFEAGWGRGKPVGLLFTEGPVPAGAAAQASRLEALRAIRRWDRYHFTPEVFLRTTYRTLLEAYLDGPADEETKQRLRRHLEEL